MIVVAKKYICVAIVIINDQKQDTGICEIQQPVARRSWILAIVIINDQKQDTGIHEIQQPVARRSWILSHNTCYW